MNLIIIKVLHYRTLVPINAGFSTQRDSNMCPAFYSVTMQFSYDNYISSQFTLFTVCLLNCWLTIVLQGSSMFDIFWINFYFGQPGRPFRKSRNIWGRWVACLYLFGGGFGPVGTSSNDWSSNNDVWYSPSRHHGASNRWPFYQHA